MPLNDGRPRYPKWNVAMSNSDSYAQTIRTLPAYSLTEAAWYVRIPRSTLKYWVLGGQYHKGDYRPLVELADQERRLLSFVNLIELHVLRALRKDRQVPLIKVRQALDYLQEHFNSDRPLIDHVLFTSGGQGLFIKEYGSLINISAEGQLVMQKLLDRFLKRVEHTLEGVPIKLYPFFSYQREGDDRPAPVEIDPSVAFGHPVLIGTRYRSDIIAERHRAGDTIPLLAEEYGLEKERVEQAIQWESE